MASMQGAHGLCVIVDKLKLHANRPNPPFPAQDDLSSDVSTGRLKFKHTFVYQAN
jgi:hypothetical protein